MIFQDFRNGHRHHLSATLLDLRVETIGRSGCDAVAIARAAVFECGFRTPAVTRPATRLEPAGSDEASHTLGAGQNRAAKISRKIVAGQQQLSRWRQTLVELTFIANPVVCLSRD